MVRRKCKHCPIPGCGSKFLVRLANHLNQVHGLDYSERRKLLQEDKLQPKIKVMVYESNLRKSLSDSLNSTQKQDERVNKVIYEVRNSRNVTYEKSKQKEDD